MDQQVQGTGRTVHGKTSLPSVSRLGVAIPYGGFMRGAMKPLLLLLLCLALFATGCATTKKLYNKMSPDTSGLKKRILVLPFWDQAGLGEEKLEQLATQFLSLLNKDGVFVIERVKRLPGVADRVRTPEFGIVTDPEYARRADQLGMNLMLTAVFTPLETQRIKTGIWPLRKIKDETEIAMYVNAFDVINGTLLLTRLESVKIRTVPDIVDEDWEDEENPEPQKVKPEIDEKTLVKSLTEIVENQAAEVGSALRERPWLGRILSSDASGTFINAGSDVSVKLGSVFEVLGPGESIPSASGRTLALPGLPVGEVKVTEVTKDRAAVSIPEGASFKAGQVIRFKK